MGEKDATMEEGRQAYVAPPGYLASQDWVERRMAEHRTEWQETVARFEAEIANTRNGLQADMHKNNLQIILAILAVGVAIVLAVLFR